jgi:cysteinyl-tRNA synthetase
MKRILFISLFICFNIFTFGVDRKKEMKNLILEIRKESPKDYIIIPQNGTKIYFNEDGSIDRELVEAIDGVTQESLEYGYPKYGDRVNFNDREELLKNLLNLKNEGKTVFTVNYTDSLWGKCRSRELAEENGFKNYNPDSREATGINDKITDVNNSDILKLSDAQNFLYLLNPEKFKHKGEYLDKLSKTQYDLLIIDMGINQSKLTTEDLEKLRVKPQGGRRLIIAYFSIGEAEDYRDYWKKEWSNELPDWIFYENENWDGNYLVKYWSKEWHEVIRKVLDQSVEAGFDGVFLDTIDTYLYLNESNKTEVSIK